MIPSAYQVALWLHLLFMVSIVGTLLVLRRGLPFGSSQDPSVVRPILRFATAQLAAGLVAGIVVYAMLIRSVSDSGGSLASQTHRTVGIKILLMLVVGACLGVSSAMVKKGRTGPAATLQWAALATLAVAALLGLQVW